MRVAVIGAGYVGLASALSLAHSGHQVRVLDRDTSRIGVLRAGHDPLGEPGVAELVDATEVAYTASPREALGDAEIVLVAVDTPLADGGAADLSRLHEAAATVAERAPPCPVLIRSTVPVGTGDALQGAQLRRYSVVSNPEFLREGHAIADSLRPGRVVAGGSADTADAVRALFAPILAQSWAPIADLLPGAHPPLQWMDRRSAELAKYASNAYLVTRLSFVNEIANVAATTGADVRAVLDVLAGDPRIGPSYLRPGLGWGGSCFPKDTRALLSFASDHGYEFTLLRAVIEQNNEQLLRFLKLITNELPASNGAKLALLGLAFKAGTRDVRQSPAVALAALLHERGYSIRAYDPAVRGPVPGVPGLVGDYALADTVRGANALVIATEWREFAAIDLEWVRREMASDLVFDGRCILDPRKVAAAGLRYFGICPLALADVD